MYSYSDMSQKMAKMFTFGRKHKNWYTGFLRVLIPNLMGTTQFDLGDL